MNVLVTGWFSFREMGATAGDLLARDLVCGWLTEAGCRHDVALAPPFHGGVDWREVDPGAYSHVIFVCGPVGNGPPLSELLARFSACRLVGVNVSMLEPVDTWNPFHTLLERDSPASARPDVCFLSRQPLVPTVGVVLVHHQQEYARAMHDAADRAIRQLAATNDCAVVEIDTRLDVNAHGLRTAAQVESLIARMDVVLTTRLHGMVLALMHGIPVVAVDPIGGGAKVKAQALALGWPYAFSADDLVQSALQEAYEHCLSPAARAQARACAARAAEQAQGVRARLLASLQPARQGLGA